MEKTPCWKDISESSLCTNRECCQMMTCIDKWRENLFYIIQEKNAKMNHTRDPEGIDNMRL